MNSHPEQTARAFAAAISRQDVAELAALMTGDHRFVDGLGATIEGREQMCAAWQGYFRMVPDYKIKIEEVFVQGSTVVMLGIAEGTYSPDGTLALENHWSAPAAWRAEIAGSQVREWRVYADNDPIRRLMAKAAPSR